MRRQLLICALLSALLLPLSAGQADEADAPFADLGSWGEALFFDINLSANRTQSCASCHDAAQAFTDPRETAAGRAVSLGDDGHSLGDRNAPSAAYAALTPPLHRDGEGNWVGGLFWDGRASTLADQAKGPPLNPIEMGLPDETALAHRLWADPRHRATLVALKGPEAAEDPALAVAAMAEAVAAYEASPAFSTFDSKYDRYLRGEVELTKEEELGRTLFFSTQFTNCNLCHQLNPRPGMEKETFSNYRYHNIGTPENPVARAANGMGKGHQDLGLALNPQTGGDPAQEGRFKVPSLRNVAVTAPYMHNGVFEDLRTVVLFYNSYNTRSQKRKVNPETGQPFASAEVPWNLSLTELETGPALDDHRVDAIVAFLKTLTDARYEPLLSE